MPNHPPTASEPVPKVFACHQGAPGPFLPSPWPCRDPVGTVWSLFWPFWGLWPPSGAQNRKSAGSQAWRLKIEFRGHFSHVGPPTFGGFHPSEWAQRTPRAPNWPPLHKLAVRGPRDRGPGGCKGPKPEIGRISGLVTRKRNPRALFPRGTPHVWWFPPLRMVRTNT